MSLKMDELLVAQKLVSPVQMEKAVELQKSTGGKLDALLVKLRFVTEEQLAAIYGEQLKVPVMELKDLVCSPNVSQLVDLEVCERHLALPLKKTGDALVVAMADPLDLDGIDAMQFVTGLRIDVAAATRTNILKATDYYFHNKPCPEIQQAEQQRAASTSGTHKAVGTKASPQTVLQALTELLIEKRVISRDDLLAKVQAATPPPTTVETPKF